MDVARLLKGGHSPSPSSAQKGGIGEGDLRVPHDDARNHDVRDGFVDGSSFLWRKCTQEEIPTGTESTQEDWQGDGPSDEA